MSGALARLPHIFGAGDRILNKYTVKKLINSGAHGCVYLADNVLSGREIAIKQIPIEGDHEYTKIIESRSQSLCNHKNVVEFYSGDVVIIDRIKYLLIEMEYIPQGSLADRIKSEFVPFYDSVRYLKDVLFALEKANSLGIVHRDIKPANIMLSRPNAKLSDFGVAYDMNLELEVIENRFYQPHGAPEAVVGRKFGPESDVFCAGMALFAALNNIPAISLHIRGRLTQQEYRGALRDGTLISKLGWEPYVPTKLRLIVSRACATDLIKRYPKCSSFRNALERLSFQHAWVQKNTNHHEWTSRLGKAAEILITEGTQFTVDLIVSGRRVKQFQSVHTTRRAAERAAVQLVQKTTLR